MKLRSITVDKFRALKHLDMAFEDQLGRIRPITVIAGPNGCGKTSVLFAVVQTLRGVMGYNTIDVPEPSDLDIYQAGSVGLSKTPPTASVKLNLLFEQPELQAIAKVFEDLGEENDKVNALANASKEATVEWMYPPGRFSGGAKKPANYLRNYSPSNAREMLRGRSSAIRGWRRKLTGRRALDEIGGIYLFPQDRNLRTRVTGANGTGDLRLAEDEDEFDGDQPKHTEPISIWGILQYLSQYVRSREVNLPDEENWEKRIQSQFNDICAPKEYLGFLFERDDPNGAPFFKDGNTTYPLQMAASGEQVIIEYVTRLNYPSPLNHSLILIDEPEVHLHPSWIRQLYRALPKIGVDNQYIVTTHSLELRRLAAEDGNLIDMGDLEAGR